jgi:hypothetical protein
MGEPAEAAKSDKTFLFHDRPLDAKGATDLYWTPDQHLTNQVEKPSDTAVVVVKRRICRCIRCRQPLPGLYKAEDGSPNPRGGRINKPRNRP